MSERGIIFLVVVALLAVAFFFPYESSDDEYYNTHGKKQAAVVQKPPGETENSHHAEGKGMGESRLVVDQTPPEVKPLEPGEPGARAGDEHDAMVPDLAPLIEQISIAKDQVARQRGGFAKGRRLEGKYVQLIQSPATLPSISLDSATYIMFHQDGTFAERSALNFLSSDGLSIHTPDDLSGHYYLKGYVLTIDQLTPLVDTDSNHQFSICPLGGENPKGMPKELYIDGKIFRYQEN